MPNKIRRQILAQSLKYEWHKRLYPSFISGVRLWKVRQQKTFFLMQFYPKSNEETQYSGERNKQTGCNGCSKTHQQMAGIDWMTHEAIRTSFHKFVPLFELDISAPILPERLARPDGREETQRTNRNTQ